MSLDIHRGEEMRLRVFLEKNSRRQRSQKTKMIIYAVKLEETVEKAMYSDGYFGDLH